MLGGLRTYFKIMRENGSVDKTGEILKGVFTKDRNTRNMEVVTKLEYKLLYESIKFSQESSYLKGNESHE